MGMLLYMMDMENMAAEATQKVAPKPTPIKETKPEPKEDKPEEKKVSKGDIMKMNVATVRAYAKTQGIKNADDMSGAELKRILGNKLFEESE